MIHIRRVALVLTGVFTLGLGAPPSLWAQRQREVVRLCGLPELAVAADFQEAGIPLGELVERLKNRYGVPLAAEGNPIADQKIILYARQQPVGALLDEIAELLGAKWVAVSGPGYRLLRGQKALEDAGRYRRQTAARAKVLWSARFKRYKAMIRAAVRNVQRPPIWTAEGPVRPYVESGSEPFVPLLRLLSDDDIGRLLQGGGSALQFRTRQGRGLSWFSRAPAFVVPLSQLPAGDQVRVQQALNARSDGGGVPASSFASPADGPGVVLRFSNRDGDSVNLSVTSAQVPGWPLDLPLTSGADEEGEELDADLTLEEREAFRAYQARHASGQASALPVIPGRVTGLSEEEARRVLQFNFGNLLKGQKHQDQRELSFPLSLLALHQATGRTVLADYFTKPQRLPLPSQPATFGDFLRDICREFGRDGRVSANEIQCRSVTWPDDELAEVPLARLRPWVQRKAKQGYLPADDWLDMGSLSELQLMGLCDSSDLFGEALTEEAFQALGGYAALQLYHRLTPVQQARARGGVLRFGDLSPQQQRDVLRLALSRRGPGITWEGLGEAFSLTVRTSTPQAEAKRHLPPEYVRAICSILVRLPGGAAIGAHLPMELGRSDPAP